jgi:hypothetical protein
VSALADDLRSLGDTPPPDAAGAAWRSSITATHLEVETGQVEQKILAVSDWDGVLRHFGLDPAEFEIEDDTVKMSSWQQSKRTESGDRDLVWLYAYKARFKRITDRLPTVDLDAVQARVRRWKPTRRTPGTGFGAPATFSIKWADWQIGKSAGGGVAATSQRVLDSIDLSVQRIKELRRLGRNVTSLAISNMGDPTEGCDGNYASQLFSVELTRREQLNLVLDLWLTGLRTLAPLFDDVEFISVLCNHGEWTRQGPGTKPVTTDSDNIGGYLGDTLRRVLADRPGFEHVRYTVPHDEMTVLTHMSGVPVALTHGHKMPGSAKEQDWIRGQSIRLLRQHGVEPRLWITAHRHHLDVKDYGAWTRLQCPTLDGGSKYYEDSSGLWSTPGTLTCLVGEHEQAGDRRFSDLAVLL